jgi:hypothetical protein
VLGQTVFAPSTTDKQQQTTSEEQMKFNKWTLGLAAVGAVSLTSAARADESKMSQVQTALSNTTISGFVDVSAQLDLGKQNAYNANGAGIGTPPFSYGGGKGDGFNLDSVDIALDRPLDESPWAAGYHIEFQLGPDSPSFPRQAYVLLRTPVGNGIDWKIGVFDTIIGYESSSAPLNPNVTRSYGYTIEPTTHTGIVASYKAFDWLTVQAGVANTSNVGGTQGIGTFGGRSTFETQKTYLGAISLTAPESWGWIKGAALNLGTIHSVDASPYGQVSPSGNGYAGAGVRDNYYAGITMPTPSDKVKVGASFDYFRWGNATPVVNSSADYSWVAGVYTTVQATDKLSFSGRAEYLDDGAANLGLYAGNVFPSYAAQVHVEEITLTAQYNLWANVLSRVEFRWDHVESGTPFGSNNNSTGNPNHGNYFILAANIIYQF